MRACAAAAKDRETTWISERIESLYCVLHELGHAHSVECWQEGNLVGGLYGVSIAGAFFGESMFHNARDASKVALVHLVARLKTSGYQQLNTQFVTSHLSQFGAIEIERDSYHDLLNAALVVSEANFKRLGPNQPSGAEVLQSITQTS